MFKKLLSNLPLNPSLLGQVSFYAKRLRREQALRRTGLILMGLSFLVQFFAFISPPQPTIANSSNDIINGGFSTRDQAYSHCVNNYGGDFYRILSHYRITCEDIANANTVQLNSRDYNGQLFSMGRLPYGKDGETPISISGTTYWLRYLWSWDSFGSSSSYTALQSRTRDGLNFFILYNCGNLVFNGLATPPPAPDPPPPPKQGPGTPAITQKCVSGTLSVTANWAATPGGPPGGTYYVAMSTSSDFTSNVYSKTVGNVTSTLLPNGLSPPLTLDVGTRYYVMIGDGEINSTPSSFVAHNCKVTPVPPPEPPPPAPDPCELDPSLSKSDPRCRPCIYNEYITEENPKCKPCEDSQTRDDKTACLELKKTARNQTQNIENANDTTATPGDIIEYTMYVTNKGKAVVKKFVIQENISDVLDYAEVVNLHGGIKDDKHIVKWPAIDIGANQVETRKITVRVKNPVPQTPASSSDPGHFDLTMTNVYGNTINIKLPGNIVKRAETVATTLPNTGPGETLAFAFVISLVAGFLFARTRLMAKEITIARAEYIHSGGQ